ncbi:hypothetical protein M408DRAFT_197372 [Serendipita vermifera MAFF 305830]|uniref:J domain-containing protein n=1 Tax=Serendipita vermifera MAFF 305830 TaxID=933852 RepID=A0A0C2XAJ9_SERVB|nr:hypothetical protein M408DRAFT_197372 [Serendipita vermifera MAFF 305830]
MDSANKEEALKALAMARKYLSSTPPNVATAKRLALKSVALCETNEAMNFLERVRAVEEELKSSNTAGDSDAQAGPAGAGTAGHGSANANGEAHTTGAEPFAGSEGIKHRHTQASAASSATKPSAASTKGKGKDDDKRDYTPEQLAVVKRIRKCKVTQYYEIMSLEKDCEEADVKKAYRKLALQLHPDKNGAPGADEAFKMVSKAFQVLSDANLRAAFDRDGGDPEARFGSGMRASGANMRSPFSSTGGFEGELSPEDLFNMFFGGGFGGGGFGNGGVQFGQFGGGFGGPPMFSASFGPNGFRTTRVRQGGPHARNAAQEQAERPRGFKATALQLLPIIFFFVLAFSNSLFDIVGSFFTTPDPIYSFAPSPHYSMGRTTGGPMDIPYFVNPGQFAAHPFANPVGLETTNTPTSGKEMKSYGLRRWEKTIEERWKHWKYNECAVARERIDRQIDSHLGLFGLGTNWEAVNNLKEQKKKVEACNELREKGIHV